MSRCSLRTRQPCSFWFPICSDAATRWDLPWTHCSRLCPGFPNHARTRTSLNSFKALREWKYFSVSFSRHVRKSAALFDGFQAACFRRLIKIECGWSNACDSRLPPWCKLFFFLFWDLTRRRLGFTYRRFGTTYRVLSSSVMQWLLDTRRCNFNVRPWHITFMVSRDMTPCTYIYHHSRGQKIEISMFRRNVGNSLLTCISKGCNLLDHSL